MGVDLYFEEQNIHTNSGEGELMLTILASFAQEESLSVSENMKWRIRKNFEEGKPWNATLIGYRLIDGVFKVVPEESETIRRIYAEYLSGLGVEAIAKRLNEEHVPTRQNVRWSHTGVKTVLKNYTYTGNLLLQKTFRKDHLTKKQVRNKGEYPMYMVDDSHEAVIDMKTYEAVQKEFARRAEKYKAKDNSSNTYPFTGKIRCGVCGKNYRRKTTKTGVVWICGTYNTLGKRYCASKQIPEEKLMGAAAEALEIAEFDEDIFNDKLSAIF